MPNAQWVDFPLFEEAQNLQIVNCVHQVHFQLLKVPHPVSLAVLAHSLLYLVQEIVQHVQKTPLPKAVVPFHKTCAKHVKPARSLLAFLVHMHVNNVQRVLHPRLLVPLQAAHVNPAALATLQATLVQVNVRHAKLDSFRIKQVQHRAKFVPSVNHQYWEAVLASHVKLVPL